MTLLGNTTPEVVQAWRLAKEKHSWPQHVLMTWRDGEFWDLVDLHRETRLRRLDCSLPLFDGRAALELPFDPDHEDEAWARLGFGHARIVRVTWPRGAPAPKVLEVLHGNYGTRLQDFRCMIIGPRRMMLPLFEVETHAR